MAKKLYKNHLLLIVLSFLGTNVLAQPNNQCANYIQLTVGANCNYTAGTLANATAQTPALTTASCANTRRDVWYRFQVPANSNFVTCNIVLNNPRSGYNTGDVTTELYTSGNCATNNTVLQGCSNIGTPKTWSGLTPGNNYLLRVTTGANTTGGGDWGFNICVSSNDTIANATVLTPGETYQGTVFGASAELPLALGCATGTAEDDVWYRFQAVGTYATVTMSSINSNLYNAGPMIQVYSGSIGALSPVAGFCGRGYASVASGLTSGANYYIRVYGAPANQSGFNYGNSQFNISVTPSAPVYSGSGRMKEIYRRTILSAPQVLADPWEVTMGPDNKLWITESKGYRVYKVDPVTGARDTVLDISQNSAFQPDSVRCQFNNGNGAQGGFAGMALHPKFLDPTDPHNYVYIGYTHTQWSSIYFVNKVVRFTYNTSTGKLGSPVSLCDTLPGSNDHNSQRMIIAPVGGTHYLFYASGDMGAGQFSNRTRPNKSQDSSSYEGKILRFNLESDGEAGANGWIPNNNPYNAALGRQSAVWAVGIRNNQGFAYDSTLNRLYGSSHGPYSDDEVNIIEMQKNYGHPIVIGYAADNNYNGSTAGAAFADNSGVSSCPPITNEVGQSLMIPNYKDPLFSAYPVTQAQISNIWSTVPTSNNGGWPSEGWSGLDLYQYRLVPGWYKSLVASSLKWGRLVRIRLKPAGDSVRSIGTTDTASYFGSTNRFRDLAISNQGKDVYVVMDRSATTSGPSAANPVIPACGGCVQKYSFVGYADLAGKSTLPEEIDISTGIANTCAPGTTVTINSENSSYWVPITGPDGEIVAEIFANGQNLGQVTTTFYRNTNALRQKGFKRYLDRNITITPQTPAGSPIKIRFYISKDEYDRLDADPFSQVNSLNDMRIFRDPDACAPAIIDATQQINPTFRDPFALKGYVLQSDNITLTSRSQFYFAAANLTLPVELLSFTGQYKNAASHLKWETSSEVNTDHFVLERSIPNGDFEEVGKVFAKGGANVKTTYTYIDDKAASLGASYVMYRLKIVDKDGEYKYSDIVPIQIPDILTSTVNLFPNPAKSKTIIAITSPRDQRISYQLIDNYGRTVLSSYQQINKGSNNITVDLTKVPAGSYYLQVNGEFVNSVQKLQKL